VLQEGIAFLFDFLLGAAVGATMVRLLGRSARNFLYSSAPSTLGYRVITAALTLGGGILGVRSNLSNAPAALLDMVHTGNLFAIVAVGLIMVLCIVLIARLIAGGRPL
jgi:hypothetical protein